MRLVIQFFAGLLFSVAAISQGPVAYYPFNGNAKDESGNNNNGTLIGNPVLTNDRFNKANQAYFFNGSDQYIHVGNKRSLCLTRAVSLAAWVKRTRFGVDVILEKGGDWTSGHTNYGIGLHQVNNNMFYFFFNGGWRGTDGVNDLNWHHYAAVAINGQADPVLYIDGIERPVTYSEGSAKISLLNSSFNLHIGAQVGLNDTFSANCIDEVRIYNRVLSADKIKKLANPLSQQGN